jgi:translation initiation factor IF-2
VIYKLIEDVNNTVKGLLQPTYTEILCGRAEVRAVFPSDKLQRVAGVYVMEGKALKDATVKIFRKNKPICESRVSSLRRFKADVSEVNAGLECGVGIDGFADFQLGDIIEFYRKEKIE